MFFLAYRLRRPGALMLVYLFGYVVTQFFIFFVRDHQVVGFLGLNWGLKQAQWTSLVVFVLLLPLTFLVLRFSKPVPPGEVSATYGIPQRANRDAPPVGASLEPKTTGREAVEPVRTGEVQTIATDSSDSSEG
jgi:phosphatidylglycerol:prolipoprotein diacylglycerol transferase